MLIRHTTYEENRQAALGGLERYYAEALGDVGQAMPDAPIAYQKTNGQVSLEARSDDGTAGRLLAA